MSSHRWICCQIGAREHYAMPRALHAGGGLDALLTDAWQPRGALGLLPIAAGKRFAERFHPDLVSARVIAFNTQLVRFELGQRIRGASLWEQILARNAWFEKRAAAWLQKNVTDDGARFLLAYSYAARDLFRDAKARGWRTVLCQIDPGPVEEEIVKREHARQPHLASAWQPAPESYWQRWREECELADHILVNSRWSGDALEQAGIDASKIHHVPLACEIAALETAAPRKYPAQFSATRPLRALFLGQICLRKGVAYLLEAARLLQDDPVEFHMVGASEIKPPEVPRNVRWHGPVPRSGAARFYNEADVFLFPTLSDGFGLTQLEAQARQLPLIASRFCGEVVQHGVNGLRLDEVSASTIADALRACVHRPGMLAEFSRNAVSAHAFGLQMLRQNLTRLS